MKKEKVLKVFGVEKADGTMAKIKTHAMLNFFFAMHNLNFHALAVGVWGGSNEDMNDMELIYKNSKCSIIKFFIALNEKQRGKVLRWVSENYVGVSMEQYEKYYWGK